MLKVLLFIAILLLMSALGSALWSVVLVSTYTNTMLRVWPDLPTVNKNQVLACAIMLGLLWAFFFPAYKIKEKVQSEGDGYDMVAPLVFKLFFVPIIGWLIMKVTVWLFL